MIGLVLLLRMSRYVLAGGGAAFWTTDQAKRERPGEGTGFIPETNH